MSLEETRKFNSDANDCIARLKSAGIGNPFTPLVEGKFSKGGRNPPIPSSPRPPAPFGSDGRQMRELTESSHRLIDEGWRLAGMGYTPEVAENLNELRRLTKR